MKYIIILTLLSFSGISSAVELPEDPSCKCQSGACPGYDIVKCAHSNGRFSGDNKETSSVKSKKKNKTGSKGTGA
jgi:hypothetical protein